MSWTVEGVMTRDVVTVEPEAGYKEVARLLREHDISAVPVVGLDEGVRRVIGMVSEADLVLKQVLAGGDRARALLRPRAEDAKAMGRTARALMTAPAVTIAADATLAEAARVMHRGRLKRLPVVDRRGGLVGILSRADLVKVFLRADEAIRREIEDEVLAGTLLLEPGEVAVSVADGVVRLTGEVESRRLKSVVARLVAGVEGVVGVDDLLRSRHDDRPAGWEELLAAAERRSLRRSARPGGRSGERARG